METIIYFSTKLIKVLRGKYSNGKFIIDSAISSSVPNDAVVNGVILDNESLLEAMGALKQQVKFVKTTVIIDSNRVVHKISILPKCTRKQMDFVVENEFIDKNTKSDTHIYDYSVITPNFNGKHRNLVLCCALERTIVSTYYNFFKDAGIKLSRIDVSISGIIGLSKIIKADYKNKIICIVDHNVVNLLDISQNGTMLSNRSRIITDEGGDNYFTEVMEKINSYIQFKKSAARGEEEPTVFIIDSNNADYKGYEKSSESYSFQRKLIFGLRNALENENAVSGEVEAYVYNLGMLI